MYYIISSLINALVGWILGFFVLYKNPKSKVNRSFFFWCLTVALWSSAYFIWQLFQTTSNETAALFWSRALMLGAIWVPVAYFKLVCVFLEIEENKKKLLSIFYGLSTIFTVLLFTPLMVKNVEYTMGFQYWPKAGLAYAPFLAMFLGLSLYAAYLSYKALDKVSAIKKYQIKYMLFGIAISIVGGSTNYFLWYNIPIKPYGNIFASTYVVMTFYAILRYRLMDIRIIIRQSVVYFLSLISVFALGFLVWFPIGEYFLFSPIIKALLILFIGATLFHPIQNILQKVANRHLFYSVYSYQKTLDKLSGKLTTILDLDKLSQIIVREMVDIMKLDRAGMLLKDIESGEYKIQQIVDFKEQDKVSVLKNEFLNRQLEKHKGPITCEELSSKIKDIKDDKIKQQLTNLIEQAKEIEIELFLPLITKRKIKGFIILGKKLSGDAYSIQDLKLLETLANQTAIAIENAQLYDQVQDLTQNLQQKIAEQTKDITQLSEMKTEFLRIVNHQLRTPTSIIKSMLSMIIEGTIKGKKKEESINKLYLTSERLETILDDLLNAQELIGQEISLNLEPTKIDEILEKIIKDFKTSIKQKNINLIINKPKEIPTILLDPILIETAFKKLIDNAILYNQEEGNITININQKDNHIQIEIRDTGAGISKEDQKELFKLFQRGKNAEQMHPNGSGLGLYIVKEYIEAHRGTIKLESEENKGTRVVVDLVAADV